MKCEIKLGNRLVVPSTDTPRIQESHIFVWLVICGVVEQILFAKPEKENRKFNQGWERQ